MAKLERGAQFYSCSLCSQIKLAKTNKSFQKRLKITRKGKVLRKHPGRSHFNAKMPRQKQLHQKKWHIFDVKKKELKRYLPN